MIAFNYTEAMNQASELYQISEELQTLIDRTLKAQQSELEYSWKGYSANLFLQKTEELFNDISKTAQKTASIASAVRTAAKVVKTAEEAAEQVIKTVGLS